MIKINCFTDNPSIISSLKFLRKQEWARKKVEAMRRASISDAIAARARQLAQQRLIEKQQIDERKKQEGEVA